MGTINQKLDNALTDDQKFHPTLLKHKIEPIDKGPNSLYDFITNSLQFVLNTNHNFIY